MTHKRIKRKFKIFPKSILSKKMFIFAENFYIVVSNLLKKATYHVIACTILMCLNGVCIAQTKSIGGMVNQYSKVVSINPVEKTVTLANVSIFRQEELPDTVLIVQMTGISINGELANPEAGLYEFHIVTHVNASTVTLQSTPGAFNTNELVQIVRVPSYKNAQINTELFCKEWDWSEGTGGVLALMVNETLTFNAYINVSERGFKGGKASEPYSGPPCHSNNEQKPDYPGASTLAGYKGEGAVTIGYFNPNNEDSNLKGYGATWNGGGGGNGQWSGGGGGANAGDGGRGGNQACSTSSVHDGEINGGHAIAYGEITSSERRMFMGGGGGAGTSSGTEIGTPGGNGGGIVVIIAKKLIFKPNTFIKANGGSVEGQITFAGAGGGGAGGSIYLSAEDYGDIHAEIKGGNGGSVNRISCDNVTNSIGSGGGGSGGFVLISGDMNEHIRVSESLNLNAGKFGENNVSGADPCNSSTNGMMGEIIDNFMVPLRGFLLNHIYTPNDTAVCYNNLVKIRASQPMGGTGNYSNYKWELSSDGSNWSDVNSTDTYGLTYLNHQFTENIYVRRIVESGDITDISTPITDISTPIRIIVHSDVVNNITPNGTTICWSNERFEISGNIPTKGGGGGPYTFEWEEYNEHRTTWTKISNAIDSKLSVSIEPNSNIQTYRRRAVSSAGCVSTWDVSVITILPAINNNEIAPVDQDVYENTAQLLTGGELTGGDGDFDYRWETSTDSQNWNVISDQSDYQPNLNQQGYGENFYRRVITSDVCKDTSNVARVRFDRQIVIPSGFSPNGDGINECFRILGIEDATSCELIIRDRYNKIVFESKSFNKGSSDLADCTDWWDGRSSSGNELPTGTYYYHLTLNGNKVYKGYVVLKR